MDLFAHAVHRRRPSPSERRVGSCTTRFEACLAFTRVTACMLTKSPLRPSAPKASAASLPPPLLRLLPGGTNQLPGGTSTRCGPTPFHGAPQVWSYPVSVDGVGLAVKLSVG